MRVWEEARVGPAPRLFAAQGARPAGLAQGVSNRDIKLENTLLDRLAPGHKPVVKLCGARHARLPPAPAPETL